jgi:hypothetical protein
MAEAAAITIQLLEPHLVGLGALVVALVVDMVFQLLAVLMAKMVFQLALVQAVLDKALLHESLAKQPASCTPVAAAEETPPQLAVVVQEEVAAGGPEVQQDVLETVPHPILGAVEVEADLPLALLPQGREALADLELCA